MHTGLEEHENLFKFGIALWQERFSLDYGKRHCNVVPAKAQDSRKGRGGGGGGVQTIFFWFVFVVCIVVCFDIKSLEKISTSSMSFIT